MTEQKDRLVFSICGSNTPPGKSSSKFEYISDPENNKWKPLSEMTNWRKVLSSLYVSPFKINDKTFNSVEHYIQYRKILLADHKKANEFTAESKSKLGMGCGIDARRARKIVTLTEEQWIKWESIEKQVKDEAKKAKFTQNDFCKQVLLATHDAELWHYAPRCEKMRMFGHEKLRDEIKMMSI